MSNKDRLKELEHINSSKLDKKLKAIAWTILIFTVISIVILALVSGYLGFVEAKETGAMPGIPLSLQYALALFVATLISLFIVFGLTAIFFWKPMKQHLEIRKTNIETNIDAASYTKTAAENNWKEAKLAKSKVKEEAKEIISNSKNLADKERREILEKAKKEQENLIQKTREQIEKEKEQLKDDIRQEILSTSLVAAEKILEKELNADTNKKMINELIDSLK